MTWQERYESYVSPTLNCWEWKGGHNSTGYGMFWLNGKTKSAHRIAYELHIGPVPEGLHLDHLCRNHGCVNPMHLEPVTLGENIRRGISHNGSKTHCAQGHPYNEKNTGLRRNGRRWCKECNRILMRKRTLSAVSA